MIGPVEQFHIDNDFQFKLKKLPKDKGCVLTTPKFTVFSSINQYDRTYMYKNGILSVKDGYKNKISKIRVPKHVLRPLLFLDILLVISVYNASPSLIILYDENEMPIISQDIYEFIKVDLTVKEANDEKELFEDIGSIMNHEFKETDLQEYKILQNCVINGGLV